MEAGGCLGVVNWGGKNLYKIYLIYFLLYLNSHIPKSQTI